MTEPKTFVCDECGGTFPFNEPGDEAMQAEYRELFGHLGNVPRAIVCDACWKRIVGPGKES